MDEKLRNALTMRTVSYWVRYRIMERTVVGRTYRTKQQAADAQDAGEVIFKVTGFYLPSHVKVAKWPKYKRRSANSGRAEHE